MRGKMDCFGLTDVGKARQTNEDQFLVAGLDKSMLIHQTSLSHEDHTRLYGGSQGQLLLVADGMGGHAGGKRASALAVETLTRYVLNTMPWFFRLQEGHEGDLEDELKASLERCQESIERVASAEPGRKGMGTTLTLAYVLWPRLYVVHAGDSRCYLLRGSRLEQITRDHTIAQRMVDEGVLDEDQAEGSRWSHILWNCLGGGTQELSPDVYKATLELGDTLLLCTDGLSGPVPGRRIRELLARLGSAEQACRALVDEALEGGGPDNVTAVVARFRPADEAAPEAKAQAKARLEDTAPYPALPAEAELVAK